MNGKVIVVALLLGAGGLALSSRRPAPPVYTAIDAYFGGAKPDQSGLPTIVLLHGEGSTPTEALRTLEGKDMFANGWPSPVRVVVPMGRFGDQKARYYVDPAQARTRDEFLAAQRQEADVIADWMAGSLGAYGSVPAKAIVVGLGANGATAVQVALRRPELVRQAYGTGGAVLPEWVASAASLTGKSPAIRKISYGDGIALDDAAQAASKERGWDFETLDLPEPPSESTVQKWLLPQIDEQLLTP